MRIQGRASALGVITSLVLGLVVAVAPQQATADTAGKGGDFVPLSSPQRVADTRTGLGGAIGVRTKDSTTVYTMTNVAGVPQTGVTAVLVDLTPIAPAAVTGMVMWEDGQPRPGTSNIVALGGTVISNAAVVPVSPAGKIALYNGGNNTHVAIEIQGYFTSGTGTAGRGGFVPTPHTWVANTLTGVGAPKAVIPANGSLTVQVPVPASATSAYVDITVYGPTANGGLLAYPAGGTAGSTVVEYMAGVTSSGATLKLGTDRKVVFVNKGSTPINLMVALEGYFSSDPATGAGLRKGTGRLLNAQTIPAQGVVDIAVGGSFGLPTRGIAGAALNFTVYASAAAAGHLRIWPSGSPEPAPPHMYFNKGQQRSDMAIVQPGPDGIVKVRNYSGGAITLYVDLQAWFAQPLPQLPVQPFARTSVMQAPPASPGSQGSSLVYSYVDNNGGLWHGHQPSTENFFGVQWTAVPTNDAFTGTPLLLPTADNKVQLVAQALEGGEMWSLTRQTDSPATWSSWTDQGGTMASPPAAGRLTDGTNVMFATDTDGRLWHHTGSTWRSLGDADLVGTPAIEVIRDGLQIFAVNTGGQLVTAAYRAGSLSSWTNLGGTALNGTPAVVRYPGYRFSVFVREGDGTIVTKRQDAESGPYSANWQPLPGRTAAGSPSALLSPVLGTTEVVVRGTDSRVYSTGETTQGSGTWRDWRDASDNPDAELSATDPTLISYTNTSGANWGILYRTINNKNVFLHARVNSLFTAQALPTP